MFWLFQLPGKFHLFTSVMVLFYFYFFPIVVRSCFIGYQIRIYTCYQLGTVFKVAGLCWKESFLPCSAVELRR